MSFISIVQPSRGLPKTDRRTTVQLWVQVHIRESSYSIKNGFSGYFSERCDQMRLRGTCVNGVEQRLQLAVVGAAILQPLRQEPHSLVLQAKARQGRLLLDELPIRDAHHSGVAIARLIVLALTCSTLQG